MIKADCHIHTDYSGDAQSSMEEMIVQAAKLGLQVIYLTDHKDYTPVFEQINFDNYQKEFEKLRRKYKDQIEVRLGIEIGVAPNLASEIKKLTAAHPFDFVIGSVHELRGEDMYFGNSFGDSPKDEMYTEYLQCIYESVCNIDEICVIGHFDYISRYGPYEDPALKYEDFSEHIDLILQELIIRGKGLEVNTSGFRYGIANVYPDIQILKRYKQLGGEIITIGSDAHCAENIALNFKEAEEIVRQAGFEYLTLFKELKPEFMKFS